MKVFDKIKLRLLTDNSDDKRTEMLIAAGSKALRKTEIFSALAQSR